jgi:hypothetical protein
MYAAPGCIHLERLMCMIELVAERNRWETPELAAEVRGILDAIEAPPADPEVMFQFQKILYRTKYFEYDARGQIILTCRCILESKGNEGAFAEPFVSAVHGACSNNEFADRGLELVEAFDQIDLVGILETMRALEYFRLNDVRSVVGQIVRNKLRRILEPAPQPELPLKPSKKERLEADKQATAAANRKIVEQKIELGRRLAALRDTTPSNQKFGWSVRKQFGLDDPLSVAEMMRVTRLYGERPEMFRNVSWHALTELASAATSDEDRREFETRISAGERVTGKEIIRARG